MVWYTIIGFEIVFAHHLMCSKSKYLSAYPCVCVFPHPATFLILTALLPLAFDVLLKWPVLSLLSLSLDNCLLVEMVLEDHMCLSMAYLKRE